MTFSIGIDVGGTFTDVVVSGPAGALTIAKAATTREQTDGVLDGIARAAAALGLTTAALLGQADRIVHGTTVATNALLEGKAARVGMLTTAGHRDVIEMREGLKPERYNLHMTPPRPLVPRTLRLGVTERIRADGGVETPLDPASLDAALDELAQARVGAVAICFLHAWASPAHEHAAAARLAAGTALSGPAGGVAAAVALTRQGMARDLITFDMGGTSTDIALVQDGQPSLSAGRQVGEARIFLPALDIVTLGAGGGSVARLDRAGLLQVGPESAGADPGPACYGQGGEQPTVTDANLVLGLLDPARFLGGRRVLDRDAARAAVGRLARDLGLGIEATAAGIIRVVNARMADGVRIATVRRGTDPRKHAILAFGGAAGLHIAAVAAELDVRLAIVPLTASVLSAWGMLNTDLRVELAHSQPQTNGLDIPALRAAFAAMEAAGRGRLPRFDGAVALRRAADMRYGEQVFEVTVALDGIDLDAPEAAQEVAAAFHARHEALYTYAMREQAPVLVNARLSVIGRLADAAVPRADGGGVGAGPHRQSVWLAGGWTEIDTFDFAALTPEQTLTGPAIVESETTTILLRNNDRARFDGRGWLEIEVGRN